LSKCDVQYFRGNFDEHLFYLNEKINEFKIKLREDLIIKMKSGTKTHSKVSNSNYKEV
jgi:hypothetical protein